MSDSTTESAPKREPPPLTDSIRSRSSFAITSVVLSPLGCACSHGSPSFGRHSIGDPTKPVSMNAWTRPT